VQLRIEVGMTI